MVVLGEEAASYERGTPVSRGAPSVHRSVRQGGAPERFRSEVSRLGGLEEDEVQEAVQKVQCVSSRVRREGGAGQGE